MEGQGESTSAEQSYEFPLLVSLPEAPLRTREIEIEVMDLFEQYRLPLLRYTVSFGVQVWDAEEIIQEVFLSLFRHLRLGRSRRNLRGWIFRVAHNLALKQRNADSRLLKLVCDDADSVAPQRDPSPNPEESCLGIQRQQRLMAVVQSMPDIEQSCIWMRAEGLRYREISKALGISLGSVSTFLTRAIAKLVRADRG
jgi:RNA polymerase sigma-70 factor (ECF subfamily)